MAKKISLYRAAMDKMLIGLDLAANAVVGTIGPRGRNVYIQQNYGNTITNDGFSVASRISLDDPEEDMGAYVVRNVSGQQNDSVGDGTTTVVALTQAIIHACLERPENPMVVRTSLNEAADAVYAKLKAASKPITGDDVKRVALISAEDEKLADIISEVTTKLGVKAVINVEDSKTLETNYEIVDGYEASSGFLSPHFADKTGKATLTDVPVLVTDRKIASIADVKSLFDRFKAQGIGQCVFVVDDIDDSMLGLLVVNKLQGNFQSIVIKAHGDTLKDIAGATGATLVSASAGVTFQNITLEQLGYAKKVVSDQHKTLFLGDGEAAEEYAAVLEKSADTETNQFLKKRIEERVAQLRGGIAIIRIAANTDFEREYLKLKAEDAIKAVQAAMEEGIVEGGGMSLWRISQDMKGGTIGEDILKRALSVPLRKILENSGKDYYEVAKGLLPNCGYNAKTDTYCNLIDKGVVDPAKVERLAVANAVSAAGTFITTFCIVTDIPPKHDK